MKLIRESLPPGEFESHERRIRHENAQSTAIIAALISLMGSVLDWFVYPGSLLPLLAIRVVASILSLLIYWHMRRLKSEDFTPRVASYLPIVIIVSICLMIWITEGGASPYYAGLNLVLVALAILMRWTVRMSLVMSVVLIFAYGVSIAPSISAVSSSILFNNFFFLLSNAILVICGTFISEMNRRAEFNLKQEVEDQNQVLADNEVRLRELDEAKTRFFANVSHELRTPLTIMLGTTETLREQGHEDLEARIDVLHANGLRLLGLIDNLLDLVRFDQGAEQVTLEAVDTEPFLRGLISGMRHLADRKEITVNWVSETDLPVLELDKDKMEKIVLNLLINAVKFTNFGGEIELEAAYRNGELHLKVQDNGIGMSTEKQEQIFSRFWQADTSSNRKFRGSGIGLSLVKSLVDLMKGQVWVQSVEGEGATFFVTLAAAESENQEKPGEESGADPVADMHRQAMLTLPELSSAAELTTSSEVEDESRSEFRLLVVDDEHDLRQFIVAELSRTHEVIEASDGLEGLGMARQYEPDLILLDYMMPGKNGVEVCRELRNDPRLAHVPIIMLTARADEKIKFESLKNGANDFVSKPFALAELQLRVKNQINLLRFRRHLKEKNRKLALALEQLKENEVQMLRHEKLSSLGRMSAGIIHEINNPLNYVQAAHFMMERHLGQLNGGEPAEDFKDALKDAREGVERVGQIISDLRSFTTTGTEPLRPVKLLEVVHSAHKLLGNQFGDFTDVEIDLDPSLEIQGHQGQLVQVFVNFFQNALDAIQERRSQEPDHRGQIVIQAGEVRAPSGGEQLICTFRDNGCGIPMEHRSKIFDPFFTNKDVGDGMGLGLSIVHQILERHEAEIVIDSEEGRYTEFQLSFPPSIRSTSLQKTLKDDR